MDQSTETVIVGGGQAGLSMSYYLQQLGREHIVLEKTGQAGEAWRNHRWDSFTLVTPNWGFRLPGAEYQDGDPHGFMSRVEIVNRLERYVETYNLPVLYRTCVTSVEPLESGPGYLVHTQNSKYQALNVVIATGLFQQGRVPAFAAGIPDSIMQLESGDYRNPTALPPGAVLVVGSAQSGCQIAEELYQSGRKVYLCTGTVGRAPRRYRGRDIYEWAKLIGLLDRTPDLLPSPAARFAGNPQVSGKNGGHTLNLHQFYRDGVILLGRLRGFQEGKLVIAQDLKENLAKVDQFEENLVKMIDDYIEKNGIEAPEDHLPVLKDAYAAPEILELDLRTAGIRAIIWACGYSFDFSLVKLPLLDEFGFPITNRGVTQYQGLHFLGMPFLHTQKSGLLIGVGEDAAYLASQIESAQYI